jgi:hypothetical protein
MRCKLERHLYNANNAQKKSESIRPESHQGIAITPAELKRIDGINSPLVKQGQSIHIICVNNSNNIMLDEKTINNSLMQVFYPLTTSIFPGSLDTVPAHAKNL